ncbi:hypothetical protein J7I93_24250 [Bacillus sp. ISL-47]|uniref:hypothetical protein n=1 Tax=Bacillus sp. ISL-47 TaxID=2819130 RepID=UPI001BE8483F|nr:hypothetical protein [Bacillus sp. ISL-47]MBT2691251.1 hypothetical protein [Bacillus sp. ISL-47]MBT2708929.1 hypothetical protein [Pseudomonas sp. ISL-84]
MGKVMAAVVLSLVFPGLGQFYNKENKKAIAFIIVNIVFVHVYLKELMFPLILFHILAAVDAFALAKEKNSEKEGFLTLPKAVPILGAAVIFISLMIAGTYYYFLRPAEPVASVPQKTRAEMKAAEDKVILDLADKYRHDFYVQSSRYNGEDSRYEITVYPKNQQELAFIASFSEKGQSFKDRYMNTRWEKEFEQEASSLLGEGAVLSSSIDADEGTQKKLDPLAIPSFEELRLMYAQGYTHTMNIKVENPESLYPFITYIKDKKINNPMLKLQLSDRVIELNSGNIEELKTPSDLEKYIK